MPAALKRKSMVEPIQPVEPVKRTRPIAVLKWTALGVGAAGLVMGIIFNRMAASKAGELEDAVRGECPAASPNCGGNPDMNKPMVPFNEQHYNLQQSNKLYSTLSLASLIVGGVVAGTSVVLFIVDRKGGTERPGPSPRAAVAPMLGSGTLGLAGALSF